MGSTRGGGRIVSRSRGARVHGIFGAGLLIGACALGSPEQARAADAVVLVQRATNACFSATVHGSGFLMPRTNAIVSLDAEGFRITEVLAREGDDVAAGQIMVRLVRRANGQTPETPAVLRAPANGLVTKSSAVVGAVANPRGDPLFRIAVDKELEIEAEVPSIHLPKLAPGQSARVKLADGREISGRVRLVNAEIDKASQLGRVRISVESNPTLRVGMFASATIDANRSCGVSVPRSAVLYRAEGTSLQVVRNKAVETRRVRVGFLSEDSAEIRDGVKENELVVANAGTSLRDGDKVKPVMADTLQEAGER